MPNFGQLPNGVTVLAATTITTNGSKTFTLPSASAYRFVFSNNTVTGTTPTLQFYVSTSFDNGTTYYEFMTPGQSTTTGTATQLIWRPYLQGGDLATNSTVGIVGVKDLGTSAVISNGPVNPALMQLNWTVSGTSPSFSSAQVEYGSIPQDLSD